MDYYLDSFIEVAAEYEVSGFIGMTS